MRRRAAVTAAAATAVLVFAAALTWFAGRRGLFAFDQSILFDAGYRVLRGQVTFRDFVLPFGPVAPALQAAAFAVLGVGWGAYVATAAVANAVVAALAMLLLRALLPRRPLLWLLGGALTAVWFYPPSGTPWFDPTAFLFVLAATVLLLPAVLHPAPGRLPLLAAGAAGVCAVLALLSKQNAGVAALPALVLLAALPLLPSRRSRPRAGGEARALLALAAGAAVATLVFILWLVVVAEPHLFLHHVLELPAAEGARRLAADPWRPLLGRGPWLFRLALGVCAGLAAAGGWAAGDRRGRAGAVVAVGLLAAQHLFAATSNNQPQLAAPFTGLLPALALGLPSRRGGGGEPGGAGTWLRAWLAPLRATPFRRRTVAGLLLAVAVGLAAWGLAAGLRRSAQDVFTADTVFDRPLGVAALWPLRWGRPTLADDAAGDPAARVEAGDLEALVSALTARPGSFFVFPDNTFLYGVLDRPAPQPLLWFHAGLTYPRDGGTGDLDRWIVADLRARDVRTVVVETRSWFGTTPRLADFPRLAAYLDRCFVAAEVHGIFELRTRRPGCAPVP